MPPTRAKPQTCLAHRPRRSASKFQSPASNLLQNPSPPFPFPGQPTTEPPSTHVPSRITSPEPFLLPHPPTAAPPLRATPITNFLSATAAALSTPTLPWIARTARVLTTPELDAPVQAVESLRNTRHAASLNPSTTWMLISTSSTHMTTTQAPLISPTRTHLPPRPLLPPRPAAATSCADFTTLQHQHQHQT